MNKIIVFDFSGTLTRKDTSEEASKRRFRYLGRTVSKAYLRKSCATNEHYKVLKQILSKKTGIKNNKKLTAMMTDLFRRYMLQTVREKKNKVFQPGIINVIRKLKKRNYKTAVVSGTRTDIIKGIFKITHNEHIIDFIFGQNPSLDYTNKNLINKCRKKGKIKFIMGDKLSDFAAAKQLKAKTIFVTWGHSVGGERKKADFTVKKPSDLLRIIR